MLRWLIYYEDFKVQISKDVLDRIIRDDQSRLLQAEKMALLELQGLLRNGTAKIDVDGIFSQSGEQRNAIIIMYLVDITLYHLFTLLESVTKVRDDRYVMAKDDLKDIAAGKMNVGLPQLLEEDGTTPNYGGISLQGETKRNNRF